MTDLLLYDIVNRSSRPLPVPDGMKPRSIFGVTETHVWVGFTAIEANKITRVVRYVLKP